MTYHQLPIQEENPNQQVTFTKENNVSVSENLRKLSSEELDLRLSCIIKKEREILSEILELIFEVNRRKLYLEIGYPSLFEYLTKHHHYTNGAAQRRIEAMRLMKDVPELKEKIKSGAINLTQVGILQKVIKDHQIQVSKEEKKDLIQSLEHLTRRDTEVLIAKTFQVPVKENTKIQHQNDDSVRLEITFSKEQWEKIQTMQNLLLHALPNGNDLVKTFEYVADRVIRQKTGKRNDVKVENQNQEVSSVEKNSNAVMKSAENRKGQDPNKAQHCKSPKIAALRKIVLRRDQCCQHRHPLTQKLCGSRAFLQVDHVIPKWAGGEDRLENLQVLCAAHNQEKYRKQAGIRVG